MQGLIALWRHESKAFLTSWWVSIWLILWCMLCSLFTFLGSSFFEKNVAELNILFTSLPWIGTILIPFLGMNLWSRERKLGTFIWSFSLPQNLPLRILCKYLATWQLLSLAVVATWPIAASVFYLGHPDPGKLCSGYLIAYGILSVQLALCLVASSFCERRLSAYLLGFAFCALIHLPGLDMFTESWPHPPILTHFSKLSGLSTASHMTAALRGVVDSRDLAYIFGLISFGLLFSGMIIQWQRRFLSLNLRSIEPSVIFSISLMLVAIFAYVKMSQHFYHRWDWTQEKLYTLSPGTLSIVEKLREPIEIKLFFSRSHAELPNEVKAYGHHIEELLREYGRAAPTTLRIQNIDPQVGSPEELHARMNDLYSHTSSEGDPMFLGAILVLGKKSLVIPYFDHEKEDQLEYEISEALIKIDQSQKPILGVLSSLPIVGDQAQGTLQLRQDWAMTSTLRKLYEVIELAPNTELIPENLRTLLIIHPKNLTEKTEYAIDQFLMKGGNLIIAVDPLCRCEMLFQSGKGQGDELKSDLPRLFKAWGIRFSPSQMVGDQARAGTTQLAVQKFVDPFQLNLLLEDMNPSNPITQRFEQLRLVESGWFETDKLGAMQWEPLVHTSPSSGTIASHQSQFLSTGQLGKNIKYDHKTRTLAGILSGQFHSAFQGIPSGSSITVHRQKAERENAVILFADVDFLTDLQAVEKLPSSRQIQFRPMNDNIALLQKSVEYVGGNRDLIHIRNSSRRLRPLTRLLKTQDASIQRYQGELDRVNTQLASLQERLSLILASSENETSPLPDIRREDIRKMRLEEAQLRTDRRDTQTRIAEDTKLLKLRLWLLGSFLTPLMILAIRFEFWRRMRFNSNNSVPQVQYP